MPLQVYSTLTRKKEPFHKRPGEPVSMYVCGPTVYKPSHVGHMVGPVIFDTVNRYLTHLGYQVTWVVNITDVDDKLIGRAKELGTTVPALAATVRVAAHDTLVLDGAGVPDFDDESRTENTRCAYPLEAISNASATVSRTDILGSRLAYGS